MEGRIQDFPDGEVPTPKGRANLLFAQIFSQKLEIVNMARSEEPALQNQWSEAWQ